MPHRIRKILLGILAGGTSLAFGVGVAAQMGGGISTAVPFVQNGTAILPAISGSTIGSGSSRVAAIYANSLDATTFTISGATTGNLSVGQTLTAGGAELTGTSTHGNFGSYPATFTVSVPSSITTFNTCMTSALAPTSTSCFNAHNDGSFGIYDVDVRHTNVLDLWLSFMSTSTDYAAYGYDFPGVILGGLNTTHTMPYEDSGNTLGTPLVRFKDFFLSGSTFYATGTGPVLKSPNGTCYRLRITNGGSFATSIVSPCGY